MSSSSHPRGSDTGTTDQVFFGLANVYVNKGAQVAHFFQGDQEQVNILASYLRAGLESGDQCVLVSEAAGSLNCKRPLEGFVERTQELEW